jgi:hypothetical protein
MEDSKPIETQTIRAHKRQLAWQILVPFLVAVLLIIATAALVVASTGSSQRTWADVSTIWLIAPLIVFALFLVFMLGFLIYGIAKLLRVAPRYTAKAQFYIAAAAAGTRKVADGAAQPFIWARQAGSVIKSILRF